MPSLGESHEQKIMGRNREVYDRRTLLSLSQSPLVHVPEALTALEECAWRPYTPRGLPANYHGDLSNKRDARQRRGHDDRNRSEFTESSRRFPAGKAGLVPASSTSRRTKLNDARKQDEPKEMAWRKTQDTESSDVPEWMANDSQAQRPSAPTPIAASGAGRVDSIQEFKMQMRAKERQQRGEAAQPAGAPMAHRAMYQDMANDEDTDSQASRFARFFSPESSRNQEDKTTHTNAMNFDLFSLLQGKKDNSSSASTPQAEPRTAAQAQATSPALQETPSVQRAAPAIVSREQVVGSPSTQSRESMPMRAAPQSDWTAKNAATPEHVDAAASKVSHAASGGPAPSAADLASMQVLMAKLMGGPPNLNASPRDMPRRNVGMQDDGSSTHDASIQRAAPPVHSAFYEQMLHSPAHTQQRESPAMHSGMPMSPANSQWASMSGSNTPPRFSHRGPPPGLNAAVHSGAANAPPPGLYPGPNTGIRPNWPNRGMYNPPGLPPPPFPPGLVHGPPPPGMQVPPGIPYGMPGGMPPHQSSAQSTPQQAHDAPRWMPPMRQHDV